MRYPVMLAVLGLAACGAGHVDSPLSGDVAVLQGNIHPLARAEFDVGAADRSMPMERMILSLRIQGAKKAALDQLLADQQDPASPDYHRWLAPDEFGVRFGPTADELAAVTRWLEAQGFTIDEVARGGTWINYSGTVAAVESAFRTRIRNYRVNGELRHANAVDPSIPRELAGLVAGVVSLHDFPRHPMNSGLKVPDYTSSSGNHYLSPGDFAIVYDVAALYAAGIDGTGQTIAIVGRTHPAASNWSTFRSTMNLPANPPQVIVNGTDPGDLGANEDGEADLDVEWSGAVAKNATIKFVVSKSTASTDGVDLSAQYIVNNNVAPVMSTSFGQCESSMGSAENTFYNNLWAQAAAAGITSFVSSGDSGASGCDGGSATSGTGRAVSGLSSTPYNVAVGGTQFNEGTGTYWNATNSAGDVSARGYIPEVSWNESGGASGGSGLWSTGGGVSSVYAKPSWQLAPGVPADGKRDVPDVSLSAAGHDGYLVYTQGALAAIGGTSASSPAFAGLMALINQKTGARQGNANPRFYQLGAAQYGSAGAAVYHDTTSGNNTVPGVTGYSCGTGYDLATGLGSVDALALANNWAGTAAPDFSLAASPAAVSVVQGATGTSTVTTAVSGGFNGAVALSASGLPGGTIAAFSPSSIAAPGAGSSTLTFTVGATTPAGSYAVTVTGTGGATTHTAAVSLTVTAAATPDFTLAAAPGSVSVVQGGAGGSTITTAVSGGFGAAVALTAAGVPTGATATFSPASIAAPGAGTSTLTLAVGAATATGTYAITVTGTGGGKTHTASVSLTVAATGGGPTTLFSDGFEGTGWSTAQVSGTAGAWTLVSAGTRPAASPHGGARLADFNSYTSASGSQTRLYRATGFAIPGAYGAATLTYWLYHDTGYSTSNDRVQVQVSTNGTTWTNVGAAASRYSGATGWAQVTVDVSAYIGATVQLGLVGVSAYGNDVYVDDVAVTAQGSAAATYSLSGAVTLSGAGLPGATVSAGGKTATTDASGAYAIAGLANGTYTATPSLAGYTFAPASQSATVNGANLSGVNFAATAVSGPTTLFSDGFEAAGWSSAPVSGTAGAWTFPTVGSHPAIAPHGGTHLAMFNSWTAASGSQTRLYRASGFGVPSSATTAALTFWIYHDTGYSTANDRVQAQVSTNGTTWTNVGAAASRYNGTTGWAQVTVDLSAYRGTTSLQVGFLGISVYGNDTYLDDVSVTAQ